MTTHSFKTVTSLGLPQGQRGFAFDPHPETEVAPPGGISVRDALRLVASGQATVAARGVAINYQGRVWRQRDGANGLLPE